MFDYTLDIGTDVAGLFVFHPDDLAHRKNDPDVWYTYDFACGKEFAAGNLLAWGTGGDGGYRLRLTDGDLTDAEQARDAGAWTFGFRVGYGQVFVDNVDCLPSVEQFATADELPDQWLVIPNGTYRVTVHALAPGVKPNDEQAEGQKEEEEEENEAGENELPDYVLCWERTETDLAALMVSPVPPDILAAWGETPRAGQSASADSLPNEITTAPEKEAYLLLLTDTFVVPGFAEMLPISEALYQVLSGHNEDESDVALGGDIAVSSADIATGLVTLARITQASYSGADRMQAGVNGRQLARIAETVGIGTARLPRVRLEAVRREDAPLSASETNALKADFARSADNPQLSEMVEHLAFEQDRVAAMQSGAQITTRLIHHLVKEPSRRAELLALSDQERARQLRAILQNLAAAN